MLPRARKSSLRTQLDCNVLVHGKGCVLPKMPSYVLICIVWVFKMPLKKKNPTTFCNREEIESYSGMMSLKQGLYLPERSAGFGL